MIAGALGLLRKFLLNLRTFLFALVLLVGLLVRVPFAWSAPEVSTHQDSFSNLPTYYEVESKVDFDASHVALLWKGSPDAHISVFWKLRTGTWSYPYVAKFDDDSTSQTTDGFNRSTVIPVNDSREVRISSDVPLQQLKIMTIDTVHGERHLVDKLTPNVADARDGISGPSVITRAQWGADESIRQGTPDFAPVTRFIVHHTDTANNDPDPEATVRAIYEFHVHGNGWNDIGYNYLIDSTGHVYEGRYSRSYGAGVTPTADNASGDGVIGAHAVGYNTGSIGISLLGDFTSTAPQDAAIRSLERTIAWQAGRHSIGINSSNVSGHRDVGSTSCPGQELYNRLPQVINAAQTILGFSGSYRGYWITQTNGKVNGLGNVGDYGDMSRSHLNGGIVGISPTPDGNGYWLLGSDGGIFSFGDAQFYGSTGSMRLNAPVVGFEPTPSGHGYWLVASDGGIFSFGDAQFYGSTGGMHLNKPVVGMTGTSSGHGYWLVASDGGIFSFGDAQFYGSTGSLTLNQPIVGMAKQLNSTGYWLVGRDGGIFAFHAPFFGSVPGLHLNSFAGAVQIARSLYGGGYYILSADGGVFCFGDAAFYGSVGASTSSLAVSPNP